MRSALALVIGLLCCLIDSASAEPFAGMIELTVRGERLEGTPLSWNQAEVFLLERDGWLRRFPTNDATDFRQSSTHFRPSSISELRSALLGDLDKEYTVVLNETMSRKKFFDKVKDKKVLGGCQKVFFDYFQKGSPWSNDADDRVKVAGK